jgi:hypothetical protein
MDVYSSRFARNARKPNNSFYGKRKRNLVVLTFRPAFRKLKIETPIDSGGRR